MNFDMSAESVIKSNALLVAVIAAVVDVDEKEECRLPVDQIQKGVNLK